MKKLHEDKEINEILNELQKEYNIFDEVKFNEFDISEKLEKQSYLYLKYVDLKDKEYAILEEFKEMLEVLIGKQYDYYRFEIDKQLQRQEIEKYYLPKDEKIRKMKKIIRKQEARYKFFDACAKAIDKQGWAIKNFLDVHRSL